MFLITCETTGTPMLRGPRSILRLAHGPEGVDVLARCHCGGTVRLRRGRQNAHSSPDEPPGPRAADQILGTSV